MADTPISILVNGKLETVTVPPMKRLLDILREDLRLLGTKEGCGEGECGACSVILDGELVNSCLVAARQADGARVETIEGLAGSSQLHSIQRAFAEAGAAQCGICTPGMIMAACALLARNSHPSPLQIREGLAGNICRCTGYQKIFDALENASRLNS
jgi:aerobic carbon-monoxide dehydrogenase small subunit